MGVCIRATRRIERLDWLRRLYLAMPGRLPLHRRRTWHDDNFAVTRHRSGRVIVYTPVGCAAAQVINTLPVDSFFGASHANRLHGA
jgi:hypothetical protein